MRNHTAAWALALCLTTAGFGAAPALAHDHHQAAATPAGLSAMKALAGEWEGKMAGSSDPCNTSFRVIAGGSTVIETMAPGTPYEMVNVYHMDGKDLMLTHYCASGNQPSMVLGKADKPQTMHFQFKSATNLTSPMDEHMHECTLRLVDADHLESQWVNYKNGKAAETATFVYTRRK